MIKKVLFLFSVTILSFLLLCQYVNALELDEFTRTVQLEQDGQTIVLTPDQVKRGKRLFNNTCSQCHNGGITKTNPNIGLDPESLSLATPSRDSVSGLIDYMKNPTSYDGESYISELHPSIKSAEIFPKMRNLTDEDLFAIAGHILIQPKIVSEKWGGGKIYY
uniref:Photosystem II extrinsic protein V n=1 Tax=Calliarthron tuberculosum TaxID=48942 RepID=M4IV53_CALTB|nr:cytochrome c550 [Calliarthron tuberculosum]AGA63762.1 cytochrome c550 [Calliarthron tuberculosum]